MEWAGSEEATAPWIRYLAGQIQSGVALRLPPHSIKRGC